MKKSFLKNAICAGVFLAGSLGVYAVPTLRLTDATGLVPIVVTITDQVIGDQDGREGVVKYSGQIGQWYVDVTLGKTKPNLGTANSPKFHITTMDTFNTGPGPGKLIVEFSEINYTVPLPGGAMVEIGGTLDAHTSLDYETYVGHDNALFSTSFLLTTQSFAPGGDFSGSATGGVPAPPVPGNVSFTLKLTLTDRVYGEDGSSINAKLYVVPRVPDAGSTLSLLGLAAAAMGLLARWRKK